jgi:hypothetical protein
MEKPLIVDDDLSILIVLKMRLESEVYQDKSASACEISRGKFAG